MATNVIEIFSDSQFLEELSNAHPTQLVVVDFFATWCGPCKVIAPVLAGFSLKYVGVKFMKVDVDKCQATAVANSIEAMPTFVFYRNQQKIDSIRGADQNRLQQLILNLMGNYFNLKPDTNRVAIGKRFPCFEQLQANSSEIFKETSKLILRYANNILRDPDNLKYRQIRLGNTVFMEKLLPVDGAVNCFFSMGFEEMDDKLLLSPGTPLDNLHALRDALTNTIESPQPSQPSLSVTPSSAPSQQACSTTSTSCKTTLTSLTCIKSSRKLQFNAINTGITNTGEAKVFETLTSHTNQVLLYEEKELQEVARTYIPLKDLQKKAEEVFQDQDDENENSLRDCLLLQLLRWFKKEFFTWVTEPKCSTCQSDTMMSGYSEATPEERTWGASRVEIYTCKKCGKQARFPRYNHPQKLLETRTGRCGEWANCFTLCCRAVGFEARYVLDWTDHVWTEVYSEHKARWLHCDSCENACDKPLVYESGWGKQLSYVIAFSKDEVIDVTWRYSAKQDEVLKRRKEVSEGWLRRTCEAITKELQANYTEDEKKEYSTLHIKELVEFITPKGTAKEEELEGRQSGDKAWRQMRGELGENSKKIHVFKLSEEHKREKRFRLRYNPVKDCYYTCLIDDISTQTPTIKGWRKGVAYSENIFRKEEEDWEMVYLARREGTNKATIKWRLDVKDTDFCIDHVTLKAHHKHYENGKITIRVLTDKLVKTCTYKHEEESELTTPDFQGVDDSIEIEATLQDGKGDIAWQHTQLFRTSLNNKSFVGLDFIVTLKKKDE